MPVLWFGGGFNPIHHAHLICARAVAEAKGFDRVILVPTAQPPHKPAVPDLAPAQDRLEMCRLATFDSPLFAIDEIELQRSGPSFTIDTARELARRGGGKVHWLIGADMLLYLPHWHLAVELIREVDFVVVARPGWELDWQKMPAEFQFLQNHVVQAPLIDIRASDIRRRVAAGLPIHYLTPPPVLTYILTHGFYRGSNTTESLLND
jgi:nicotinate-nucleotide adenylyltransferase